MHTKLIWVLVADGGQARFFEKETKASNLLQTKVLTHTHAPTHEHGHDRPGRAFESASPARHAYEPQVDWHAHQKELFAKNLVEAFIKEHQEKKFCHAHLICPPVMMGHVRHFLSPYLNKLLAEERPQINETSKDMTHCKLEEIENFIIKSEV